MRELEVGKKEEETYVSFCKEIEPMSRAEWVRQARRECEKELPCYENTEIEVENCRYVDLTGGEDNELKEVERNDLEEAMSQDPLIDPMQEGKVEKESSWENQRIYRPEFEFSYLTKFVIRLAAAVLLAIFVIAIDYFRVSVNGLDSDVIRTAIQKNDRIESVEDTVTAFARDKVLPIFQKD